MPKVDADRPLKGTTAPAQAPQTLLDFGHALASNDRAQTAMEQITRFAVDQVPEADAAGLTLATDRGLVTIASTSDLPDQVDTLQYTWGGPCVEALTSGDTFQHVRDLTAERRWPRFTQQALEETPVRSILSCRLSASQANPVASLNLYATSPDAFTADNIAAVGLLAAHSGLALAYLQQRDQARHLAAALDSNRQIGAAVGILMSRRGLTQDQAFAVLRAASQRRNRKLRDVADEVIERGDLAPDASRRRV